MVRTPRPSCPVWVLGFLVLLALSPAAAQQITYEYDALGRLLLMSAPEGVARYEYDAVGNILRIVTRRSSDVSGPVAILLMNPAQGPVGTEVHLYGKGFAPTPADNQLAFNGAAATVTAATTTRLVTTVPTGATTGPIMLTTPLGSATSPEPFTVLQGFAVVPEQATVLLGKSYAFQAALDGIPTSAVTWRVNGTPGGSTQLGTISPAGLYTAPATLPPVSPVTIEAVLTADPTRVASGQIMLLPPTAGGITAARLSVGPATPSASAAPLASAGVSVGPVPPPLAASPVSAPSLSVAPPAPALTGSPLTASTMSVSAVPVVTGVAPASGARGTSVLVTLTGAGLAEATALVLLANGSADPLITVSGFTADGSGTQATATLMITGTAALGGRILQITVGSANSTSLGTGRNGFTVQ